MNKRPPLDFDAIKIAANGKFIDTIFPAVGIQFEKSPKQHQPCPVCGGTDRFRCDNKKGSGSWFCSHCGAGDGFKLVELYTNTSGYDLMKMVGGILGIGATSSITPEQRAKWQANQTAIAQAEINERLEKQAKAQEKANRLWNNAKPHGNMDYVHRKQIVPMYARFLDDCMLVPMVQWDKNNNTQFLRNVQRIYPDGEKKPLYGGEVNHCYCPLGTDEQFANPSVLLIGEGYATCVSVAMAINLTIPVVVAFTSGNLLNVGQVMRERYPNCRIIFIADNDMATADKTGKNTGIEAATEASKAVGGEMIIPNFDMVNSKAVA